MKQHFFFISLLATLAFFLMSCNDEPTGIGSTLLNDTLTVETLSSESDSIIVRSEYYQYLQKTYTSETALVGRNSGITSAYIALFYSLPDSIGELTPDRIVEADLNLCFEPYQIGNPEQGLLSFDMMEVTSFWSKVENDTINVVTYDSLFVSPANYFGRTLATYSGMPEIKDSVTITRERISLPEEYIADISKFDETDTVRVKSYGIAFVPKSDCSVIRQLRTNPAGYDDDTTSHIRIVYLDESGTQDSVKLNIGVDGMFNDSEVPDESLLYVQPSIENRIELEVDLEDIPRQSGIIKTELVLTLDTENSVFSNEGPDSLLQLGVFASRDDNFPIADYVRVAGKRDSVDSTKYIFYSLSGPTENIVRSGGRGSLIIYPYYYQKDNGLNHHKIDRMAFFGPDAANPANRPKYKVAFSYIKTKE